MAAAAAAGDDAPGLSMVVVVVPVRWRHSNRSHCIAYKAGIAEQSAVVVDSVGIDLAARAPTRCRITVPVSR